MTRRLALVAFLTVGLTSCASPLVQPNPFALQSKATQAINWRQLAERAVDRLPHAFTKDPPSVYVAFDGPESEFSIGYIRFLQQALYEHRFRVALSPDNASFIMKTRTQSFIYDKWHNKRLVSYLSTATTGGGILYFGAHLLDHTADAAAGAALAIAPVADTLVAINGVTDAEVTVSTSVESPDHRYYDYLGSEIIYVKPQDLEQFFTPGRADTALQVRGDIAQATRR